MSRSRVLSGIIGAVFCLTLVSSVRADSLHADMLFEKLFYAERHNLIVINDQLIGTGYLYAGHFEHNNGKHLGFSMMAVMREPELATVKSPTSVEVSQNPEPTAMVLLGTGLAAVGAFARKANRKRKL